MGFQVPPDGFEPAMTEEERAEAKKIISEIKARMGASMLAVLLLCGPVLAAPRVTEDPSPISTVSGIEDSPDVTKGNRVGYAPMLDAQKRLGVYTIPVPGDPNEPNRSCSAAMGETALCEQKCAAEGGIGRFPQPIWVAGGPGSFGLNLQVRSCEVHTVGGRGVMFCECFSMGRYTKVDVECEEPAS